MSVVSTMAAPVRAKEGSAASPLVSDRILGIPSWGWIVGLALLAFAPALSGGILHWDDSTYLADPAIEAATVPLERIEWIARSAYFANYNPLHRLSYWLQLMAFGKEPTILHLVSIILHALNSLLVVRLARVLGARPAAAFIAGALFAVHPTRVEVVAWISAQKDLLSVAFALLATLAWCQAEGGSRRKPWAWRLGVATLLALACASKSMMVTLPAAWLALDIAKGRPWLRSAISKSIYAPVAIPFALATWVAAPAIGPQGGDWGVHLATFVRVPWLFLERVLWPLEYSGRWWVERPESFASAGVLLSALALAVATVGVLALSRSRPWPAGLFFFWPAACLLPVLNLVPIPIEIADRYLYLALVGPAIALGVLVDRSIAGRPSLVPKRLGVSLGALILAAFVALSRRHAAAYEDSERFWRQALAVQPENLVARQYLAEEILAVGGADRAPESLRLLEGGFEAGRKNQSYLLTLARTCEVLGREGDASRFRSEARGLADAGEWRLATALDAAREASRGGRGGEAHAILERVRPRYDLEVHALLDAHGQVALEAGDLEGFLRWNAALLERRPLDSMLWYNREVTARRLGLAEEAERAEKRRRRLEGDPAGS